MKKILKVLARAKVLAIRFIANKYVGIKWYFFGRYYTGLTIQARYLYRQSWVFKERWNEFGLEYAEDSFTDMAKHFYRLAEKEPLAIRAQIFCDAMRGRELGAYCLPDKHEQ